MAAGDAGDLVPNRSNQLNTFPPWIENFYFCTNTILFIRIGDSPADMWVKTIFFFPCLMTESASTMQPKPVLVKLSEVIVEVFSSLQFAQEYVTDTSVLNILG